MKLKIKHKISAPCLAGLFERQEIILEEITMRLSELETKLNSVSEQLTKSTVEIVESFEALRAELVDVALPESAVVALDEMAAKVQVLDDLNPDVIDVIAEVPAVTDVPAE